MKEYEYYLFDWDGNLAKTLNVWLETYRYVAGKRGVKVTDKQIGSSFGDSVAHMAEWGIKDPIFAMSEADTIAGQKLPSVELYPDAVNVLKTLSNHKKQLALITTSPHKNIQALLEKHDLNQYFEAVVAADDTEKHKPDPEPLERAIELLKGMKENAVMIGDSDKDIGAARNYGIDSILFYPSEHHKFYDLEQLKMLEPTFIIDDFKTILEPFS